MAKNSTETKRESIQGDSANPRKEVKTGLADEKASQWQGYPGNIFSVSLYLLGFLLIHDIVIAILYGNEHNTNKHLLDFMKFVSGFPEKLSNIFYRDIDSIILANPKYEVNVLFLSIQILLILYHLEYYS
ncbi:MAG: hypothetical protein O2912_02050 [Proteobacteria bacterium]|nr:hypothetical protein [Pseudomonadota bacterium]